MFITDVTVFVNLSVFSVISKMYVLIGISIIGVLGVVGMIVGFIIEDKTRKKDIEVINKCLNELNEEQ